MQKKHQHLFIRRLVFSLVGLYLLAIPHAAVRAGETNFTNHEYLISSSTLVKNLSKLCNDNTPGPLEFPDGFSVSIFSVACETVFPYEQGKSFKAAIDFAYGRKYAGISGISQREHELFARISGIAKILEFEAIDKNTEELWATAHHTGTASGLYAFLNSKERKTAANAYILEKKYNTFLKQHYSEKFVEFLLNPDDVIQKNNTWEGFKEYLDLYFKNLQGMSKFYSNYVALNLFDFAVSISRTSYFAELSLLIPDEIASDFLAIFSFSADLNKNYPQVKWLLRARVFSAREQRQIYGLGDVGQFYNGHLGIPDNAYVYNLLSIRDRVNLNAHHEPRLVFDTLSYIKLLEQQFPGLNETYSKYFKDLKDLGVWELDPENLKRHYIDVLGGSLKPSIQNIKDRFLFGDILSISRAPWNVKGTKLETLFSPKNDYLKYVNEIFFNDLRSLSYKTNGTGKFEFSLEDQLSAFKTYGNSLTSCNQLELLQCRKMIVDPDLLKIGVNQFTSQFDSNYREKSTKLDPVRNTFCNITKPMKKWVSEAGTRGAVHFYVWALCRLEQVADLLSINEDSVFEHLPKLMFSSGTTGYNTVSSNTGFVTSGGGLIAHNAMSALKVPHVMPAPNEDDSLHLKADRRAKTFFKLFSELSIKPTFQTKHEFYRNARGAATIYAQNGQFERALITLLASLEDTVRVASEDQSWNSMARRMVQLDLTRIKALMRLIGFPESQIVAFTKEFIGKLKWNIEDAKNYETIFIDSTLTKVQGEMLLAYLNPDFTAAQSIAKERTVEDSEIIKSGTHEYVAQDVIALVNALGLPRNSKEELCSDQMIQKRILGLNEETEKLFGLKARVNMPKFGKAAETVMASQYFFYEFLEFYHICQKQYLNPVIEKWRSGKFTGKDAQAKIIKTYANQYLGNITNNWVNKGLDFSDVRFLPALTGLSRIGRLGAVTSEHLPNALALVGAKYAFLNLSQSFVMKDSSTMRSYQPFLESIISNASDIILRKQDEVQKDPSLIALQSTFLDLEASARIVVASDATRKRLIGLEAFQAVKPPKSGWLGVGYSPVAKEAQATLEEDLKYGALIVSVVPGSSAAKSNIQVGDIIYEIDNKNVRELTNGVNLIPAMNAGELIEFKIYRNGERLTKPITIEKNTNPAILASNNKKISYRSVKKYFDKMNNKLASSKNLGEFILAKASFGEHNNNFLLDAFIGGDTSQFYMRNRDHSIRHITINYDEGFITATDYSSKGAILQTAYIPQASVQQLIKTISRNGSIKKSEIDQICEVFKPFWSKLDVPEKQIFTVTPSLNLMPIPLELILGSACKNEEQRFVIASSFLAGVEFQLTTKHKKPPNIFVGHANPIKSNQTFKISLADVKRGLSSLDVGNNQNLTLPPLPDASIEVTEIAKLFDQSHTFIDREASIRNVGKKLEALAFEGSESVILFATHGLGGSNDQQTALPALLSIENNEFEAINSAEINSFNIPNSTVLLSACDTASGITDEPHKMFTGLVESFANGGASLLLASLWPVGSLEAKRVTTSFVEEWKISNLAKAITKSKAPKSGLEAVLPFVYIAP